MSPARRAYAKKNSPVILSESVSTVTDEVIRRRQEQAFNDLARLIAVRLSLLKEIAWNQQYPNPQP